MKYLLYILLLLPTSVVAQDDIWELFFTAGDTRHHALLVKFSSGGWVMRVRYYDSSVKNYQVVEQQMRYEETRNGFRLAGYDPVYANTTREHPTYIADNLYFIEDKYGDTQVVNLDDAGVETPVTGLRKITDNAELGSLLKKFKWD